jgi:hypothetical protein
VYMTYMRVNLACKRRSWTKPFQRRRPCKTGSAVNAAAWKVTACHNARAIWR